MMIAESSVGCVKSSQTHRDFMCSRRGPVRLRRLDAPYADTSSDTETGFMLTAVNLHKTYRKNKIEVPVLCGLNLEAFAGEFLSIVGASGSGKSTLLHLLGTLDAPDKGEIYLEGQRIDNLSSDKREALRNGTFGFIFQFYHLLPELTTL